MEFKFQRKQINKIPESDMLNELERVAKQLNYVKFGRREFDKVSKISSSVIRRHFGGSWEKALDGLNQNLQKKGLSLLPRPHSPNRLISDKDLFSEMERIWKEVGQRPSQIEWNASKPRISYSTYKKRFGGWTNACLKFTEHKMGKMIILDDKKPVDSKIKLPKIRIENKRDIPLKLRLKVLEKYNFRCSFCGRSPATDPIKLHIDHIVPVAKGGKTILENLQVLCYECNLGKGKNLVKV